MGLVARRALVAAAAASAAAAAAGSVPRLDAPQPNVSLPAAGLALAPGATHGRAFRPDPVACAATPRDPASCLGTYNHAPEVAPLGDDTYVVAWHNGDSVEDSPGSRVLAAASADGGASFGEPVELFGPLSEAAGNGTVVSSQGFQPFGNRTCHRRVEIFLEEDEPTLQKSAKMVPVWLRSGRARRYAIAEPYGLSSPVSRSKTGRGDVAPRHGSV